MIEWAEFAFSLMGERALNFGALADLENLSNLFFPSKNRYLFTYVLLIRVSMSCDRNISKLCNDISPSHIKVFKVV